MDPKELAEIALNLGPGLIGMGAAIFVMWFYARHIAPRHRESPAVEDWTRLVAAMTTILEECSRANARDRHRAVVAEARLDELKLIQRAAEKARGG